MQCISIKFFRGCTKQSSNIDTCDRPNLHYIHYIELRPLEQPICITYVMYVKLHWVCVYNKTFFVEITCKINT